MLSDTDYNKTKKDMEQMHSSLLVKRARIQSLKEELADLEREILQEDIVGNIEEVPGKLEELENEMIAKHKLLKEMVG